MIRSSKQVVKKQVEHQDVDRAAEEDKKYYTE
jgi:hypothetical protein